jgi:hypothetical protein
MTTTPPGQGGAPGAGGASATGGTGVVMGDGGSPGAPPSSSAIPDCKGDEVPAPRRLRLLTRAEYANTVADLLAIPAPPIDNFPVESIVDGFDNNVSAAVVTNRHLDEYLATGERLATQALAQSRGRLVTCAGAGCDRTFVTAFGLRAFRRPLTDDELTRYLALFATQVTGGIFDKGVELTIRAMLASPSFLYRFEVGTPAAGGGYQLTPYEIASALSYFLWATTPDDALLTAARTGGLDRPEGIETQARRLLLDPRSRPAVATFFRQWLGTAGFLFTNKDQAIYPAFNDDVRKAMVAEADAFVGNVVYDGTHAFGELFTAEYVLANGALAAFYGLPGGGAQAGKISVPGGSQRLRGGLMTLGAVLGSAAHPNESSPVRRGLFVRTRLLCQSLPPPPPTLNIMPPGLDPTLTTRARFARHSTDKACSICHALMDPVGFGFERYDGVGAYRATENGMTVDASGSLTGLESLDDSTVTPFDGPVALGAILARSPNAQACIARQLFRYARGGERDTDACAIKGLQAAFTNNGLDLQKLLLDVIRQPSFLTRTEGGSP